MTDYSHGWKRCPRRCGRRKDAIILAVLSVFCFAGMVIAFVGGIAFIGRPKNS